ncbi:MAG: TetR family transcriptional regulator [Tumebacillaceae bacterium]
MAEQVLRRFGTDKTTVVDVARALNVSHGTIYRHFPSKASLREAVAERWLHSVSTPLASVFEHPSDATTRLRLWFDTLMQIKHGKVQNDPELFAMYSTLAEEAVEAVTGHIDDLVQQVTQIVAAGMETGEFRKGEPRRVAQAIFFATARFHHPALAKEWASPTTAQDFNDVWNLILSGIVQAER